MQRVLTQLDGAGLLTTSAAVEEPDVELDLFPAPPNAGGTETIGMSQNSLGLAWGSKFL